MSVMVFGGQVQIIVRRGTVFNTLHSCSPEHMLEDKQGSWHFELIHAKYAGHSLSSLHSDSIGMPWGTRELFLVFPSILRSYVNIETSFVQIHIFTNIMK